MRQFALLLLLVSVSAMELDAVEAAAAALHDGGTRASSTTAPARGFPPVFATTGSRRAQYGNDAAADGRGAWTRLLSFPPRGGGGGGGARHFAAEDDDRLLQQASRGAAGGSILSSGAPSSPLPPASPASQSPFNISTWLQGRGVDGGAGTDSDSRRGHGGGGGGKGFLLRTGATRTDTSKPAVATSFTDYLPSSPSSSASAASASSSSSPSALNDTFFSSVTTGPNTSSSSSNISSPITMANNSLLSASSSSSSSSSAEAAAAAASSTPLPGYINLQNISFDESSLTFLADWDNYTDCSWNASAGCLQANQSNATLLDEPSTPDVGLQFWALILILFPLFTVFGNTLVVMSVYREKSLRTVTNYFIVSLAVADIMVAVLVMPLAVYVEVNQGAWRAGDALCDTWVALDVMCCTASILNLTGISVDRFIAVTQPIKYAKHKNSKRVYVMLGVIWVVSLTISAPIALGMNYTEARAATPELCIFYNSDFLIYSSMGSFYIPCVIMILLYWRIFRAIRQRARKSAKAKKNRANAESSRMAAAASVIENRAQTQTRNTHLATTTSDASCTEDSHRELLPAKGSFKNSLHAHTPAFARTPIAEETSFTNYNARLSTGEDTAEDESHSHSQSQHSAAEGTGGIRSPISDEDGAHVIPNDKSALSPASDDGHVHAPGYNAPSHVEVVTSPTSPSGVLLSPPPPRRALGIGIISKKHVPKLKKNNNKEASPKKSVTKFNFHLRHSKKKKDKGANRRERKATKTLAIVLGVFLLCWVPFFTVNILNAFCIRFEMMKGRPECNIDPLMMSFFVWLGYINSFLNPVIYTIFNIEFRKAFKKLLQGVCKKR